LHDQRIEIMAREFQERDRFVDAVFREELKRLNSHLPKDRKTLEDLLADSSPAVSSVSGHPIRMKKEQLEELSQSLPAEGPKRIRLPIVLLRTRDLGTGAFRILGDPYEEYSILLLTNTFNGTFEDFRGQTHGTVTIYKPQVSQLLRRFHSLIVIGFGTAGLEQ
jgi:uncharacterized protein (UPF0216 family)